jgi:hypothetical protein
MYTNINICGVLLFPYLSAFAQDIIRASTLFILVAVATVWFSGNLIEVYHDLIDSFTPDGIIIPHSIKTGIMIFYDTLFHLMPCLILGLPYHIISLFVAYGIIVIWYIMTRHRLPTIYSPKVSFDRGIIVAGIVGALMAIWIGYRMIE